MGLVKSKGPVVLIVEDEFLLRMGAVDMIAAAGFEAVEAANADQAIKILEARRGITVVFTDIQMPGSMDGLKLARAVRGRWPRSRLSRPPATSGLRKRICRKAESFYRSPTAQQRLQACCER
jgi:CheY-like chemotaxis protein